MKKPVTKEQVSRYRQEVNRQIEKLKTLALKAGYPDLLFGGVPCEVYRTCGKSTCRCARAEERHGPETFSHPLRVGSTVLNSSSITNY